MGTLKAIWWKLYPNADEHRWIPLIWLPFMVWFFVDPYWKHYGPLGWMINTFLGLLFIWFYLQAFSRRDPYKLASILAMTAMAAAFIPFEAGNVGLLIYAAAAGGFYPNVRRASALIALDVAVLGWYVYRLSLPITFWGSMLLLIILVGFFNLYWALKHCAERSCAWPMTRSSTWPKLPNASASRAICTICWVTRCRSSR